MIDILIIGAGPSGLCAAKTFLQHDPAADVVLIDNHASLGGVWSRERLYPTLKTNNLFGTLDFSDFPMDRARFGVAEGEHVAGETMHAYLRAYADHFRLTHRIRLDTKVLEIRRRQEEVGERSWDVRVDSGEVLQCGKLVVATGVLSSPHMPRIQGMDAFAGPVIHSSELGRQQEELTGDPAIKTVAVLGGGKSAYDAVYLAASSGHHVEWVIRQSGRGPVWVFPTHTFLGPFKAWREKLVTRRLFSFMSPWTWPDYSGFGWLRRFLHFSPVGKAIAQGFWGAIHSDTIRDCRYRTDERYHILEPEQNPFWYGTASGTLNYERDFLSFIDKGQVRIHRADISHISKDGLHTIVDGQPKVLRVDALVASTGYSAKPSILFSPSSSHSDLGVPSAELSKTQTDFWASLDGQADLAIGEQFPRLLDGPFQSPKSSTRRPFHPGATSDVETPYTPWRLYRAIAPPGLTAAGDRSLVFIGMFSNIANTIRLEIQCLWALAYFNNRLPTVDQDVRDGKVLSDTALFQRYTQHRSPYGHGRLYPDLVFDQMPYWDVLLHDLGLETRRKRDWWHELLEPYSHHDYKGIVDEWLKKTRGQQ